MSASLVGSEMCIRDSFNPCALQRHPTSLRLSFRLLGRCWLWGVVDVDVPGGAGPRTLAVQFGVVHGYSQLIILDTGTVTPVAYRACIRHGGPEHAERHAGVISRCGLNCQSPASKLQEVRLLRKTCIHPSPIPPPTKTLEAEINARRTPLKRRQC
eukprot:1944813-Alexandrium_andersonii.AAC.1